MSSVNDGNDDNRCDNQREKIGMRFIYGEKCVKYATSAASFMVGRSESEPIMIPTLALDDSPSNYKSY